MIEKANSTIDHLECLVVLLFSYFVLFYGWVGYLGYVDDDFAIKAAQGWINSFPYLGQTHWELRHPLVLSIAISIQFSLGRETV